MIRKLRSHAFGKGESVNENQAVIFAPEAKTRQWLYKKEIQDESIPKYYLDFAEYNAGKLDKIAIFFMNLKNDIQ